MPRYTQAQIIQARQADLTQICRQLGYTLRSEGSGNYRIAEHAGVIVQNNHFTDFSGNYYRTDEHGVRRNGGNPLDFLCHYHHMDYNSAMAFILGYNAQNGSGVYTTTPHPIKIGTAPYSPQKADWWQPAPDNRRLFAYLHKQRCIDYTIIKDAISAGRCAEAITPNGTHNGVFPFFTSKNTISGAEFVGLTNKRYKGIAPDSNGCWFWQIDKGESVYIFESAIDALSYYELFKPKNCVLVSLSGVKPTYVPKGTKRSCYICTDADTAGDKVANQFPQHTRIRPTGGKDWNEVLCKRKKYKYLHLRGWKEKTPPLRPTKH